MSDIDLDKTLMNLKTNQDAVERFLALYDLYKVMMRGRPSVAQASEIDKAIEACINEDRDLNVRAWARYLHGRLWGKYAYMVKPDLPKMWRLLIIEDI